MLQETFNYVGFKGFEPKYLKKIYSSPGFLLSWSEMLPRIYFFLVFLAWMNLPAFLLNDV